MDDWHIMTSVLLSSVTVSSLKRSFLHSDPYLSASSMIWTERQRFSNPAELTVKYPCKVPQCCQLWKAAQALTGQVHLAYVQQRECWCVWTWNSSEQHFHTPTDTQNSLQKWEGEVNVHANTGMSTLVRPKALQPGMSLILPVYFMVRHHKN